MANVKQLRFTCDPFLAKVSLKLEKFIVYCLCYMQICKYWEIVFFSDLFMSQLGISLNKFFFLLKFTVIVLRKSCADFKKLRVVG